MNTHKPNVQPSDLPQWTCYCQPPNNLRTGPGWCPSCGRFPYLKDHRKDAR